MESDRSTSNACVKMPFTKKQDTNQGSRRSQRHSESLKTRVGARSMVHSIKSLPFTNEEWILVPRRHTKRERIGKGGKGREGVMLVNPALGVARDISTPEAHWPISLVDLASLRSQ